MYATVTPVGTLTIRAALEDANTCELWLEDDFVGAFPSAAAAARSVSDRCSGCESIDEASAPMPRDIDDWEWISVSWKVSANQPMFLMSAPTGTL